MQEDDSVLINLKTFRNSGRYNEERNFIKIWKVNEDFRIDDNKRFNRPGVAWVVLQTPL